MTRSTHKTHSARTYGIEIEAYGVEQSVVAQALRSEGIACEVQGYNHMTCTSWKLVNDGSIRGTQTFELVSPPLSGAEGLRQISVVSRVLQRLGAKVNTSCGLHVHHDANDLTLAQWKKLLKVYLKYEQSLDSILPASRRNDSNPYCRALGSSFPTLHAAFAAINRASTLHDLASIVVHNDRYHKLNLMAFWRHGTLEFRSHSGTIDAEKIQAWVSLTQGLIEQAILVQQIPVRPMPLTALFTLAKVSKATQTFYLARQAALAA